MRLRFALLACTLSCGGVAPAEPATTQPPPDPSLPVLLASAIRTSDIVVDARGLYVTNATPGGGGSVVMLAKTDGAMTELASGLVTPFKLAGDESTLYVGTGDGVQAVAKTGGALVTIAAKRSFDALDRTSLYRVQTESGSLEHPTPVVSTLFASSKTDGAEHVLFVSDVGYGNAMGADESGVYVQHGTKLAVVHVGTAVEEPLADLVGYVSVLVLDADAVYVGTMGPSQSILRIAKSGGAPTRIVDTASVPLGLAVDATHVYFTDVDGGLVVRAPKNGGPTETVAEGQARPVAIAVDDANVYWANIGDETIMKKRK